MCNKELTIEELILIYAFLNDNLQSTDKNDLNLEKFMKNAMKFSIYLIMEKLNFEGAKYPKGKIYKEFFNDENIKEN